MTGETHVRIREEIPDGAVTERVITREQFEREGLRATAIGSRVTVTWVRA